MIEGQGQRELSRSIGGYIRSSLGHVVLELWTEFVLHIKPSYSHLPSLSSLMSEIPSQRTWAPRTEEPVHIPSP